MHLVLTTLIKRPRFAFALSTTAPKQILGAYVFAYEQFTAAATSSSSAESRHLRHIVVQQNVVVCDNCWPTNVDQQLLANICLSCVRGLRDKVELRKWGKNKKEQPHSETVEHEMSWWAEQLTWRQHNALTAWTYKPVGDVVGSLLTIGNALYSPIFLQSCSLIHESGQDNPFQRYGHSKFSKMTGSRILNLVQPEVVPFDPPSPKTLHYTVTQKNCATANISFALCLSNINRFQ